MVVTALPTKPGISTQNVSTSIPASFNATWFKSFIANYAKGADVRNAIAGPGITITGTIASPYATISAGGPFNAPLIVKTTPGGITVFEAFNSLTGPTVEAYGPTAGALVDLTPDTGTFTATLTGCTTAPTAPVVWARVGNLVMAWIATLTGTSNTTSKTITGWPTEIQAARAQNSTMALVENASASGLGALQVEPSGAFTLLFNTGTALSAAFTGSGTAGLPSGAVICYILN